MGWDERGLVRRAGNEQTAMLSCAIYWEWKFGIAECENQRHERSNTLCVLINLSMSVWRITILYKVKFFSWHFVSGVSKNTSRRHKARGWWHSYWILTQTLCCAVVQLPCYTQTAFPELVTRGKDLISKPIWWITQKSNSGNIIYKFKSIRHNRCWYNTTKLAPRLTDALVPHRLFVLVFSLLRILLSSLY